MNRRESEGTKCHRCETSVLLLVGLPGCGKSTLASSLVKHYTYSGEIVITDHELEHGIQNASVNNVDVALDSNTAESIYDRSIYDDVIHIEYDAVAMVISKGLSEEIEVDAGDSRGGNEEDAATNTASADANFSSQDLEAWRRSRNEALNLLGLHLSENYKWLTNKIADKDSEETSLHVEGKGEFAIEKRVRRVLIIMDDNFHLRSMRRDIYRVCQDFISQNKNEDRADRCETVTHDKDDDIHEASMEIGLSILHVDTPLDQCIVRNEFRKGTTRYIPEQIIYNMDEIIEVPDATKAKFESCTMRISDGNDDIEEHDKNTYQRSGGNTLEFKYSLSFYNRLDNILKSSIMQYPIRPKAVMKSAEQLEQERQATLQSRLHQVDLMLRTFVGVTCRADRRFARVANTARKSIMAECKKSVSTRTMSSSGVFQWEDDSFILGRFQELVLSNDDENAEIIILALNEASNSMKK